MPGVPALSCAAHTLGMCTQGSINQWNCCCSSCLVLISPSVQRVEGLQCLWLSQQQWADPVCAIFRLRCNSQFSSSCFMEKRCQAFLCFHSALSGCSKSEEGCMRLCQEGLCLQSSSCDVLLSQQSSGTAGVWYLRQPQHTKSIYFLLHKLSQFESLSLLSLNSYCNGFFSYFNPFSLLSKPSLQVERGRRTNEEVESYGGRKRERNCKPSKTVAGKVLVETPCVEECVYCECIFLCIHGYI